MAFNTADFRADVLAELSSGYYFDSNKQPVKGQAVSFCLSQLRDPCNNRPDRRYWKNLGGLGDFESLLEENGFQVIKGSNKRGNPCRIVTAV